MTAANERIQTLALLLADARRERDNLTELLEQAAQQHMANLAKIAEQEKVLKMAEIALNLLQTDSYGSCPLCDGGERSGHYDQCPTGDTLVLIRKMIGENS